MSASVRVCLLATALALSAPALACSICRCGDPTFNALGSDGVAQTGLRVALDWDDVGKSQGDPREEPESMTEHRTTLLLAYGLNDRVGLFARLPYSERDLVEKSEDGTEHTHTSGWSDPEFSGQLRLWSSPMEGDVGTRASVFLVGGVKTAWGEDDLTRKGERLDEHVQPGTGSTDIFGGVAASYQLNPRSALFSSVQYRETGRNDAGYRYGNALLANFAYEHKLGSRWDMVVEFNYRNAGRDEIDHSGEVDPDTGGTMYFVTPRVLFDAGHGWVFRASAQLPVTQSGLNGFQDEDAVINLGVTLLAGK
jgi:hypothetical protein